MVGWHLLLIPPLPGMMIGVVHLDPDVLVVDLVVNARMAVLIDRAGVGMTVMVMMVVGMLVVVVTVAHCGVDQRRAQSKAKHWRRCKQDTKKPGASAEGFAADATFVSVQLICQI